MKKGRRLLMHLRYGTWRPVRLNGNLWTVVRFWCGIPVDRECGIFTKREAEGTAALNNDSRGLL